MDLQPATELALDMTTMPSVVPVNAALRESAEPAEPADDRDAARLAWRCDPELRAFLEAQPIDWLNPRPAPGFVCVKRNAQRSVWRLTRGGRDLFLKCYLPNGWTTRLKLWLRGPTAAHEWEIGRYAETREIPAVRSAACGWIDARRRAAPSWLVTQTVPDAVPLADYWLTVRHRPLESRRLIRVVARLVARAHQSGFHHRDLHAGNVLVRRNADGNVQALFVDLHNVHVGRRVPVATVLANLAQLNQWFRRHATRTQRLAFLKHYLADRDAFAGAGPHAMQWRVDLRTLLAELDRRAATHAERLWAKRDRRARRDNSYFCRIRPAPGWSAAAVRRCKHVRSGSAMAEREFDRSAWCAALARPLDWLRDDRCTVLKDSHTAFVCRAELTADDAALPVLIKRPLPRTPLKRLAQWLGRSRNVRTWRMANQLIHRDLPTAHPLAVVERRVAGLIRADSLLFTEWVASRGDLEAYLSVTVAALPSEARRREKTRLIEALVRLLRDLYARGFVHRDFKASNVLVAADGPQAVGDAQSATTGAAAGSPSPNAADAAALPRLVLVDLDGVSRTPRFWGDTSIWRAVVRLNASLSHVSSITRTDRLRFLKRMMLAPGRSDRDWKLVWRDLEQRTDRKLRDKARRRRWKLEHYGRT